MLRNRLMGGVSWLPLFAADDEAGGGAAADPPAQGNDAPPPAEGAEGAADPPAEGTEPPPAEEAAPPAQSADWRDREIKRKHAQLQEEKRARQQVENELETARALLARRPAADGGAEGGAPAPAAAPVPAAPMAPEEVQRAAAQLVDQREFERASGAAFDAGMKNYGDKFKEAIDRMEVLGGFDPDTLAGILATDDPAKVLFELGSKPDEFRRVMDLPPHRRLAEMVKLGLSTPAPKRKVSDAPPPAEGIRGQNRPDGNELRDDLTDEDWYARRDRQRAAKFAASKGRAAGQ